MDFTNIEIIVSEVDGIITNGVDAIDAMNNTIFKSYHAMDLEVINLIKPYFTFVFLSSDPAISYGVMRSRNIPFYFTKTKSDKKVDVLHKIISKYNTTPENLLYIGSKYSDDKCMKLAEFSVSPYDGATPIKNMANYISPVSGGYGVICDVYELLMSNKSNFTA